MRGHIENLQVLRFIAALMVLIGHSQHALFELLSIPSDIPLRNSWNAGVDAFFIVSGFIMYYLSADKFGKAGESATFVRKRFIRIAPLYWLFTTLMIASFILAKGQISHSQSSPMHIVASYLFIPFRSPTGEVQPVLALGWTLNYEAFFYAIFAFSLLFSPRKALTFIVGLFVALAAVNPWVPRSWDQILFWSSPIIIEFLLGMALAYGYLKNIELPAAARIAISCVGVGLIFIGNDWSGHVPRWVWPGLPALLLAAGLVLGPRTAQGSSKLRSGLVLGGDASYALYLSHPFCLGVVAIVFKRLGLPKEQLFVPTAVIGSIVAALLVHKLIEKPMGKFLTARFKTRPMEPATSAP